MTGSGPLAVAAYDAQGRKVPLAWGPEPHGGSNYRRPATSGGGYRFPSRLLPPDRAPHRRQRRGVAARQGVTAPWM